MSNYPPEIATAITEPSHSPRRSFAHDPRDSTQTHRIIFGADRKWSIVGYGYGSPVVSSHDTIQEARDALKAVAA